MRLGAKLLGTSASLNNFKYVNTVTIYKGEDIDVYFQLVDKEQSDLRFVPPSGSTCMVSLPRLPERFATSNGAGQTLDKSLLIAASNPFPDDRSIWKISLSASVTPDITSTNMGLTVFDGSKTYITTIHQAIQATNPQD